MFDNSIVWSIENIYQKKRIKDKVIMIDCRFFVKKSRVKVMTFSVLFRCFFSCVVYQLMMFFIVHFGMDFSWCFLSNFQLMQHIIRGSSEQCTCLETHRTDICNFGFAVYSLMLWEMFSLLIGKIYLCFYSIHQLYLKMQISSRSCLCDCFVLFFMTIVHPG